MRYSKNRKGETREKILLAAHRLFSRKGYDGVSIDEIMRSCELTRGGFYAHFKSKSDLYRQAMSDARVRGELQLAQSDTRPNAFDAAIKSILCEFLQDREIRFGESRWDFLVHDLLSDEGEVRASYASSLATLLHQLRDFRGREDASKIFSAKRTVEPGLLAMIIGTAAIARSVDERALAKLFADSCGELTKRIADEHSDPLAATLWEGLYGDIFPRAEASRN